ncbi:zinc finger protein, putative [Plasmodium berghei]|uniref:Zinc finger protein, putative n=2 Tax=Plasmodium berghei TaxID=5821 RepID=A0A509AHW1_PLABA|nr:zinc finger protein, putative [Plasmodium berghei ANKA]CXI03859.1 zinc finger protein, putative [Plasmodium berghei]SCL92166.1 zinc finger protein, putative [Plasmodium berghei]SCM15607.1 zinc finger protein, putative [Plasmodium berghei]SCM17399.1 zinc finger protein, putative [Plasmodium berghei]SCN22672.1 zinc finger protein, putative [Plasmodium berghei]|eukprot:XP_034420205.1 zinc finger protein, putative [Plasmodium berghei ANKA]
MHNKKGVSKYGDKKTTSNMAKEKVNNDGKNKKTDDNLNNVVNTSERRILFYKTKICPWYIKGKCERRKTCLYAHAQNELRELPNLCKTSLCPKLKINETCNDKKCKYAHTNIELRATENLYKTALCESFSKGKCFSGQFCRYAHGQNELRENPMEITDKNIIIGTCKTKNENINGINNNKSEFEKKKGGTDSSSNEDNSKRNEAYYVLSKKKERNVTSNKYNILPKSDGISDIRDSGDIHIFNDTNGGENIYEFKNKLIKQNIKNVNKNSQNNNGKINGNNSMNGNDNNKRVTKKMTKQANKTMNKQIDTTIENQGTSQVGKRIEEIIDYGNKQYISKNTKYNTSNVNHKNVHKTLNNLIGPLANYLKHEESSKFNEEQFLNDNLNVLSFLDDNNNSIEKFRKNYSSVISDKVVNNENKSCYENYNKNKGVIDNQNILICDKENKNNPIMNNVSNNNNNTTTNNNNFPSSLLKFNIQNLEEENEISNLVDVHNNDNVEINNKIGNINYYKYEGMENMDIVNFNSFEFENNNNRVMDNESSNIEMSIQEHNILSKNLRNVEFKNNETENNFYINRRNEMDIRMYQRNNIMNNMNYIYDNNLVWNGNNEKCENYWGNGNTEKCESWDNYLGFEKEKTFNSEKDYFKIFNYGMCNNIGNKFNYCDPHKNQINKYDNSLFIL